MITEPEKIDNHKYSSWSIGVEVPGGISVTIVAPHKWIAKKLAEEFEEIMQFWRPR